MEDYDFENENESDSSSRGFGSALLNIVAVILIVGACGVVALLIFIVMTPDNFLSDLLGTGDASPSPTLISVAEVPTIAPTGTPVPTDEPTMEIDIPATNTPIPPPDSLTRAVLSTPRPTMTSTLAPTLPPNTATPTNTPTPTDTATPGPSPTVTNTRSPFPFTKDLTSPQYLQNYANTAGCDWMGVAGIVLDESGNPVPHGEYVVHVWDGGIDLRVVVGDAPAYGPSGYEQFLFNEPRFQENNVQMETRSGTAVSQVYRLQTRTSCNENLIRFDFIQNH